jgi:hypothetical protein
VDLALRSNQLLPEQGVLGQQGAAAPDEVHDHSEGEPQEVHHLAHIARLARGPNL